MNGTKVFKDPVHGTIKLHPLLVRIIDTPQFQRLRSIKQMGGKYFVYPGASHNRFEHSIGVAYLAGEFLETLRSNQKDLNITERDVLCVQIAGLCHDLGHGPFSHVFDSKVAPRIGAKDWKHEDASVLMFEYMLHQSDRLRAELTAKQPAPQLIMKDSEGDYNDLVFIKELILGCPVGEQHREHTDPTEFEFKGRPREKWFLFEIVSNQFTGIDVDKWDYFARDCHGLGLSYDFDWKQYTSLCQVLEDSDLKRKTICAQDKEVTSLYDMFHAREMLHRKALQQETCVSIELMLADALVESCHYLKEEMAMDVSQSLLPASDSLSTSEVDKAMSVYEQLNDTILQTVLMLERRKHEQGASQVGTISKIWRRLQERKLYQLAGSISEMKIKNSRLKEFDTKKLKEKLKNYLISNGGSSELEWQRDFEVYVAKFDYGMKDQDPLKLLKVHSRNNDKAQKLTHEEKSKMLPKTFEEKHIRLYCKKTKQEEVQKMKTLFDAWCQKMGFSSPNSPTPDSTPPQHSPSPSSSEEEGGGGREATPEKTSPSPTSPHSNSQRALFKGQQK